MTIKGKTLQLTN